MPGKNQLSEKRAKRYAEYRALPPLDVLQRYSIEESAAYLRQSVTKTYADIAAGRLNVLRCGGRTYCPGSEIARVSRLSSESVAA